MKGWFWYLLLLLFGGCSSLEFKEGQMGAVVIQADTSGVGGFINGKTTGCAVILTADSQMRVTKLEFDAETNKCVAEVVSE